MNSPHGARTTTPNGLASIAPGSSSGTTTIPPLAPVPRLALRSPEAAEALGISQRTLHDWTRAGDVPHIRIGGVVMYPVDQLRDWLRMRTAATSTAKSGQELQESACSRRTLPPDPPSKRRRERIKPSEVVEFSH